MRWVQAVKQAWRWIARRPLVEREFDEELRCHLEMEAAANIRRGMSADDAWEAARRSLGSVALTKENCRQVRFGAVVESAVRDLRFACRSLRRDPAFTLTAGMVLTISIGACTTVYSVVNAVLLRELPYREPDRLVRLFQSRAPSERMPVSPLNYSDWRDMSSALESAAAYRFQSFEFQNGDSASSVAGARASASLFDVLGVHPVRGRSFTAVEDQPGGPRVAVISHRFWRNRMNADANVIGKSIVLGGAGHSVIGVMPPEFYFPSTDADIWTPLRIGDESHRMKRTENYLNVIGRLKPGVPEEAAVQEFRRVANLLAQSYPASNAGLQIAAVPLTEHVTGAAKAPVLLIFGAVMLTLIIALSNVAHLQMARALARSGEAAIRAALGGSSGRIAWQTLSESLVLCLGFGAAGALAAWLSADALRIWLPASLPRRDLITVDFSVLSFAFAMALLASAATGLAPTWIWRRRQLADALKGSRTVASIGPPCARAWLMATQIAFSFVLITGTALMMRSLWNLLHVDAGFESSRVLTLPVAVPFDRASASFAEIVERVRALPGVRAAAMVNHVPLTSDTSGTRFTVERRAMPDPSRVPTADYRVVTPGYFATIGAQILQGRDFTSADTAKSAPVCIVNHTLASRFWPGENPVGARIRRGGVDSTGAYITIAGVVADMKQTALDKAVAPEIFIPHAQFSWPEMVLTARIDHDEASAAARDIRAAIASSGPLIKVGEPKTMEEWMVTGLRQRLFATHILSAFGVTALLLVAAGIFGVVSYTMVQRTREIGIRMALGAKQFDVWRMAVQGMLMPVAAGLTGGLCIAFVGGKWIESLLFEVTAADLGAMTSAAAILLATALIAASVPARRAGRLDPMTALKQD